MGDLATASGEQSIAIGKGSMVTGDHSGAFGDPNTVTGNNSYAFGNNNTIGAANVFVLGNGVAVDPVAAGLTDVAAYDGNVVLGDVSETDTQHEVDDTNDDESWVMGGAASPAGKTSGAATVSVGAAGAERQIINVAPGVISASSTDAINGSQLYYTNANFEGLLGDNVKYGDDGLVDWNAYFGDIFGEDAGITDLAGALKPWNLSVGETTVAVLPGDTVNLGSSDGNINIDLTPGNSGGDDAGGGDDVGGGSDDVGGGDDTGTAGGQHDVDFTLAPDITLGQYESEPGAGDGTDGSLTLVGDNGGSSATIKTTADGTADLDQVDEDGNYNPEGSSQRLTYTDSNEVEHEVATMDDGLIFGGNAGDDHSAKLNTKVNVKGADANTDFSQFDGGENIMTEMQDNTVRIALAKDLNVDSVTAETVNAKTVNSDTFKAGDTVVDGDGLYFVDGDGERREDAPSVGPEGIDAGGQRMTNVAPGVNGTDAVNVNQLRALSNRVEYNDRRASAGIAAAIATAGLPQAYLPGKSMFGISAGTWRGESGFAMGLSRVSDNGRWIVKGTATGSSRGDYGGSVGVGFQW